MKDFMALLADDFVDGRGNSREDVHTYLLYRFFREEHLSVFVVHPEVAVEGEHAHAKFYAVVSEGRAVKRVEDLVPEQVSVYRFDLELAKIEGAWRVAGAEWEGAEAQDVWETLGGY